jgi:predicted Zn-dependent peptidase
MMAWRSPGAKDEESEVANITSSILYNGMAGLIDLDINQEQKTLFTGAFYYDRSDYGDFILEAEPKQGQSLDELKEIMLEEVAKLRSGDFSEDMVKAAIENYKLRDMRSLERNSSRAMKFVDSFINGHDWAEDVASLSRIEKITKQDVVDFANKYLGENNYALVYKHLGVDKTIKKIDAPKITPIKTNREMQSDFLKEAQAMADSAKPIEPVFPDFSKDLQIFENQGLQVIAAKNDINDITTVSFVFDKGLVDDPALETAFNYASYLGTKDKDAKEIASEMYAIACNFYTAVYDNTMSITVSGLSENIGKALDIVQDLYANAEPDEMILDGLKADLLKARIDNKLSQRACNQALRTYVMYGPEYVKQTNLTNEQLDALTSDELLEKVHGIFGFQHKVCFYGPQDKAGIEELLNGHHKVAADLTPLTKTHPAKVETSKPEVYVAQYDARQFNYSQFSNRNGDKFDLTKEPALEVYDEYFGGSMNSIVFQEMRESKALAYSAGSQIISPSYKDGSYSFIALIGSQNDKLQKAVEAFDEIINDMPKVQKNFDIAVSGIDSRIRTDRVYGMNLVNSYLRCQELGISEPISKYVFEHLGEQTLDTLMETQQNFIKGRTYVYGILGDTKDLDMNYLKTLGPVKVVPLDEVFGY